MRQWLREYVEVATGLAEQTGKLAVETAAGLLGRAGVDVAAAERTVETLAREAVTVGRTGVDLAVGLARAEGEKAFERLGKLGDQVVKVGVVLAYLEGKLRDLEGGEAQTEAKEQARGAAAPAGRAEGLFAEDWAPEQESEPAVDDAVPFPVPASVPKASATKASTTKAPATKTAVKKAAVKKASVKKAPAKKAAGEQAAPADKGAAKKAAAKKTATAKKATAARKAGAPGSAAAEKAAAPRKTAKKTAEKAAPADGGTGD
ncbi:hypothetical protein ACFW1A_18870 [Kitasatospora sp. NPDC058965]|uniref:hypothetical protein n=1 Tax=Kitasatospora sp. NPDC058965 TaxID=3346682 RepID=UPI0036B60547